MKKMVLVPEAQFRQMQQSTLKNSNSSLLSAVGRPVHQEMVKKFNFAQQILNDPTRPSDAKISEYTDAMSEFATLRNKVKGVPNLPSVTTATTNSNKVTNDVVNTMPASLQSSAQRLMERMEENKDVISWTPSGAVTINGEQLRGTHIADLVGDVVRATQTAMPERDRFLRVLAELNTPEALIKNRAALRQYRLIRKGSFIAHPPGVPGHQIDGAEVPLPSTDDEDKFGEPYKSLRTTGIARESYKKLRATPQKRKKSQVGSGIQWVTT